MNNDNVGLSKMDAQKVVQAADVLIGTVRRHDSGSAYLELESFKGEKWRITIERVSDIEETKQ
jgi:hypothetical protein